MSSGQDPIRVSKYAPNRSLLAVIGNVITFASFCCSSWKRFGITVAAILGPIATISGAYLTLNSLFGVPLPKDIPAVAGWAGAAAAPASTEHCDKFEPGNWQTGQGLLVQEGDIWTLATSAPNGLFRYEDAVALESNVEVTFIPYSDKEVNFVATLHDIYEVVVGDGSYQGVTVKIPSGKNMEMNIATSTGGERRNVFPDGPMEKGMDVKIVMQQGVSRLDSGEYELNLRVARRSLSAIDPERILATYTFPLPPDFNFLENKARFSIGLKAASDESKVAAEILCVNFD